MQRREFLTAALGAVPFFAIAAAKLPEDEACPAATDVPVLRLTPEHPDAHHFRLVDVTGQRVDKVTWYEYPSGRYGRVWWAEDEVRKATEAYLSGTAGISAIEWANDETHTTHEPDGSVLLDMRTGEPWRP